MGQYATYDERKLLEAIAYSLLDLVAAGGGGGGGGGDASAANQVAGNAILTDIESDTDNLAPILAKLSADPATQTTLAAVLAKLSSDPATQTTLAALSAKIPALGQALAAASMPVVLTAAQIATLTPVAAITNYANETGGNLAALNTALGTTAGAAVTTDANGTLQQFLRGIVTILGAVTASPVANSIGDRLKALLTGIVLAAGTNFIGSVGVTKFQGAANLATSQVTTSTSAATLAVARSTRRSVTIKNTDSAIVVYIGPATVTAGNGLPLKAGESVAVTWVGLIQVIAASGTPVVAIADEYD